VSGCSNGGGPPETALEFSKESGVSSGGGHEVPLIFSKAGGPPEYTGVGSSGGGPEVPLTFSKAGGPPKNADLSTLDVPLLPCLSEFEPELTVPLYDPRRAGAEFRFSRGGAPLSCRKALAPPSGLINAATVDDAFDNVKVEKVDDEDDDTGAM